jgi:hypothetical protein
MSSEPDDRARDGEREREAPKKAFALRLSTAVFDGIQRWADDELRSLNAQIEYLLRDALRKAGRWRD